MPPYYRLPFSNLLMSLIALIMNASNATTSTVCSSFINAIKKIINILSPLSLNIKRTPEGALFVIDLVVALLA